MMMDSMSLPRDILRRITWDRDDLTVLFWSLPEAAGTETGDTALGTSPHRRMRGAVLSGRAQGEIDIGLRYGGKKNILSGFGGDADRLIEMMTEESDSAAAKSGSKQGFYKMGILNAALPRCGPAEEGFSKVFATDPGPEGAGQPGECAIAGKGMSGQVKQFAYLADCHPDGARAAAQQSPGQETPFVEE